MPDVQSHTSLQKQESPAAACPSKTSAHEVVDTIATKHDENFVEISVAGEEDVKDSLSATTTHPFWSPSGGGWVDAGDLHAGMTLRTVDGRIVKITATRHFTQQQTTYDLTISGVHTYYVLAGGHAGPGPQLRWRSSLGPPCIRDSRSSR
jgi:hypothetical protein